MPPERASPERRPASRLVLDADGRPLLLGAVLGRGGEGAVHDVLGRPDLVAKVDARPITPERARKLALMAAHPDPRLDGACAWPRSPLFDADGRPVGVLLPKLPPAEYRPLHDLTVGRSRAEHFPRADWRFLVRAARNLSGAVAAVHACGHVVGDLSPANVLVTRRAEVRLIDTDSFQLRFGREVFLCPVGTEAHTPPELQGADLRAIRRAPRHDAFGLATLVFSLLFLGRSPHAGVRDDGELRAPGEAIRRHEFAYGARAPRAGLHPPPHTLPFAALPRGLRGMFERAFGPLPALRPTARAWMRALGDLEGRLVVCAEHPRHRHPRRAPCPWCPLEAELGRPLFGA